MIKYAKILNNMTLLNKVLDLVKKYWYMSVLVLFCLTPLVWFLGQDPKIMINGLDTNFPLDPLVWFGRRFFVWDNIVNAGGDASSSVSGLFFHLLQAIPYFIGFSLKWSQIINLIFWFSAVVFSSFFLAKVIVPKSKLAQIIIVSIYSYNTYLFNTWENVKVSNLSLYVSLPLFLATIYLLSNKSIKFSQGILYFCLASILASGSGINPAYFSVIIFLIFITAISLAIVNLKEKVFLGTLSVGILAFSFLIFINLFWILPLINDLLLQNTRGLADIGLTNWLYSLSENTSFLNVMRLQGAWDWYSLNEFGMPQYLPYTLNYLYRLPFIIYSFVFPALTFVSLLFFKKEQRYWYFIFGFLTILGVFLGMGSHPPTGTLFIFLSEHIPFFSFYRSPWYIFTPLLILAYAGLIGLLFNNLFEFLHDRKIKFGNLISGLVFWGMVISNLLYCYPLVNGKIFRPGRSDSYYVRFPEYVWSVKDWLTKTSSPTDSRIITYPEDQLEIFKWGYRGTGSILNLYSNREVVVPSFSLRSKTISAFLNEFCSLLRKEDFKSAFSMLRFFGIDEIFVKKDISTIFPEIKEAINQYVTKNIFGDWIFMKPKGIGATKIFSPNYVYVNLSSEEDFVYASSLFAENTITVSGQGDTEVDKIKDKSDYPLFLRAYNLIEKSDENNPQIADDEKGQDFDISNVQKYDFSLPKDGIFSIAVERYLLNKSDVVIKLDSMIVNQKLLKEDNNFIIAGPLGINKGKHLLTVEYPIAENLLIAQDYRQIAVDSGLKHEELPADISKTLLAFNPVGSDKRITFQIKNFNPFLKYAVGFDYKYLYGSVPVIDIFQTAPNSPVKKLPIDPGGSLDWEKQSYIFEPVPVESKLELTIKMSPNKPGDRSKTSFENIFFRRIYDNKVFLIENMKEEKKTPEIEITFIKKSPVKYEVAVTKSPPEGGYILGFLESYSSNWLLRAERMNKNLKPAHFKINGYANGWYLPQGYQSDKFTIYYRPQTLFIVGAFVSGFVLILTLGINLYLKKKSR